MDICNICQSELINKKLLVRARMKKVDGKPVADRVKYEAWCPSCEVYLRKTVQGRSESDWKSSHISIDELKEKVSENEILQLKLEIKQIPDLESLSRRKENWVTFISMKKDDDDLYHYIQEGTSSKIKGYVIKRGTFLIGSFVSEITNKE